MRMRFLSLLLLLLLFRLSVAFNDDLIEMSMSNLISLSEQLGRSMTTTSLAPSPGKPFQSRANVPQSLTLLMNFKNDGTTLFQIMHGRLGSQFEGMHTGVELSREPSALHECWLV